MTAYACSRWEDVSAAADGELAEPERGQALDHARRCASCGPLLATVSTTLRFIAADAPDGVRAPIDRSTAIDMERLSPRERRWMRSHSSRWLLAVAAIVIVAQAIPTYATAHGLDTHTHAARHLATWQIGFGVGLVVAAAVSRLTHAMLALAATFAILTVTAAVIDIVNGHPGPWAEPVHLVELVAIVLLWQLTPPHLLPWRHTPDHDSTTRTDHEPPNLRVLPPGRVDGPHDRS